MRHLIISVIGPGTKAKSERRLTHAITFTFILHSAIISIVLDLSIDPGAPRLALWSVRVLIGAVYPILSESLVHVA